ncbi:uncharacterized protein BDZ99DRAFT_549209 [Mytilinidion resinicola]|uniref:F-box domain-containing protein n=1 Tax=Mytilinidion resinicola TaxID=574789 RepID=A0A6A6Z2I8_9PEZI|nr:uncharacterized protein BDZ99DRAFT_549209 [Mytilinidion resinicola]KAF2814939.1 hypothetical protein BDZ99DRAFT_549209 [Mytilinidion resinicola]
MALMEGLPTELQQMIFDYLPIMDLAAISISSKKLHSTVEQVLYRSIAFSKCSHPGGERPCIDWEQETWNRLMGLLETMVKQPNLASSIRIFELETHGTLEIDVSDDGINTEWKDYYDCTVERPSSEMMRHLKDLMPGIMVHENRNTNDEIMKCWTKAILEFDWDAAIALVLVLGNNLQTIKIAEQCEGKYWITSHHLSLRFPKYVPLVAGAAAMSKRMAGERRLLANLRQAEVPNYRMVDLCPNPWIHIPSLGELTMSTLFPEFRYWAGGPSFLLDAEETKHCGLRALDLSFVNLEHHDFESFLKSCGGGLHNLKLRTPGKYERSPNIWEAVSAYAPNLEKLTLVDCNLWEEAQERDLSKMLQLKAFSFSFSSRFSPDVDPAKDDPEWYLLLPQRLEELAITGCPETPKGWDFFDSVDSLVEVTHFGEFPALRSIRVDFHLLECTNAMIEFKRGVIGVRCLEMTAMSGRKVQVSTNAAVLR